jgi:RNA polymerase sigma factor (sigma-70 family)
MNEIYYEISKLSKHFRKMCYGLTKNHEEIKDAVQELMLYFLQMNPETLKSIWEKDGKKGIIRYGAVVLNRALTSKRSPFYYKYKKYYTNLYGVNMTHTSKDNYHKSIYNMPETVEVPQWEKLEKIDSALDKVYWYDKKVFELYYYDGNTLDSLAEKTGISRNSLFSTIDKVRSMLKDVLNE